MIGHTRNGNLVSGRRFDSNTLTLQSLNRLRMKTAIKNDDLGNLVQTVGENRAQATPQERLVSLIRGSNNCNTLVKYWQNSPIS